MGQDKGLLQLKGKALAQYVLDALQPVCDEVFIVANDDAYQQFGVPVYKDEIKAKGPIAGIYTGLKQSKTDWNLVVACDMPFITTEALKFIAGCANERYQTILPIAEDRTQPLCALYSRNIIPKLEEDLNNERLKMNEALKSLPCLMITMDSELDFYTSSLFLNMNSPDDFNKIVEVEQDS
jgi:molybdopterin-guanine dinucleotide biosynthesis protein A